MIEATLRLAVGETYFKMGLLTQAERHLRRLAKVAGVRLAVSSPLNLDP